MTAHLLPPDCLFCLFAIAGLVLLAAIGGILLLAAIRRGRGGQAAPLPRVAPAPIPAPPIHFGQSPAGAVHRRNPVPGARNSPTPGPARRRPGA
jgi:hypothetical protein